MRAIRFLSILVVVTMLANTQAASIVAAPIWQTSNLLRDPSFEQAASGDWKWQSWKVEQMALRVSFRVSKAESFARAFVRRSP
jgi:hypothetical protein